MSGRTWSDPASTELVEVSLVDPDTGETTASATKAPPDPFAAGTTALELALELMNAPFAWLTVAVEGVTPLTVPVMDPSFPDSSQKATDVKSAAARLWREVYEHDAQVELSANGTRRIVVVKALCGAGEGDAVTHDDLNDVATVKSAVAMTQKKGATRHEF